MEPPRSAGLSVAARMVSSMGRRSPHRIEVSCCVCGIVREVRPSLVKDYTHLVCGPCARKGERPAVPQRPGMVLVHTINVAGYFDGYTYRIADMEERASVERAKAILRVGRQEMEDGDGG